MQLKIQPFHKNLYPIKGFFIKNKSLENWVREIQYLGLDLTLCDIYPLPDTELNSHWGCLVLPAQSISAAQIGKHEGCVQVSQNLWIPEKTRLYPQPILTELDKILAGYIHVMHPDFGFVVLGEKIDFQGFINIPDTSSYTVHQAIHGEYIPKNINAFLVQPQNIDTVLEEMERNVFPKTELMPDESLNFWEKIRLGLYHTVLNNKLAKNAKIAAFLAGIFQKMGINPNNNFFKKAFQDLEELERRNRKEIDKLMSMFQDDIDEALKYAIPLDSNGTNRGSGDFGSLDLSSLSGVNFGSGSGKVYLQSESYELLRKKYIAAAEKLIQEGKYEKAAYVYMKLLKSPYQAADALEQGGFYEAAAAMYLKHTDMKSKAAECYEKGKMLQKAIEIYKELGSYEKVGDLYLQMGKKDEAMQYYTKVVKSYISDKKYLKAAFFYRDKMQNWAEMQEALLKGWCENIDNFNCLNNYLNNIDDEKVFLTEVNRLYADTVNHTNSHLFLKAIRYMYPKKTVAQDTLREIAYEIVSKESVLSPKIISELRYFNTENKGFRSDMSKYLSHKKT